jgi:hypothetical protein
VIVKKGPGLIGLRANFLYTDQWYAISKVNLKWLMSVKRPKFDFVEVLMLVFKHLFMLSDKFRQIDLMALKNIFQGIFRY